MDRRAALPVARRESTSTLLVRPIRARSKQRHTVVAIHQDSAGYCNYSTSKDMGSKNDPV